MKNGEMLTWRGAVLSVALGVAGLGLLTAQPMQAQQDGGERSQYAGMEHSGGEVVSVDGATLTIKTDKDVTIKIVTTTNTRIMKGRGNAVKLADLKPGDGVMAIGNLDGPNGTMHAAMVFATDAAQLKAMKENLGKTYIAGKVTAIDTGNATVTVERPDHVSQTIQLDETTSIRRGGRGGAPGAASGAAMGQNGAGSGAVGESITMADMKVGDMVRGTGALKNNVFVPVQIVVMLPGAGEMPRHRDGNAGTSTPQ